MKVRKLKAVTPPDMNPDKREHSWNASSRQEAESAAQQFFFTSVDRLPAYRGTFAADSHMPDVWVEYPHRCAVRPKVQALVDKASGLTVGTHISAAPSTSKTPAGCEPPSSQHPSQQRLSPYAAERAERIRVDADCVALARAWVERIGLALPLDDEYVDRFWPLQAQDVEVAFLYYFAARAHARPDGRQLFAGLQAGAPHILAQWYPPSFWRHLRALGIEGELRGLPSPACIPSLDEMKERLRERYDHQFLYRWYMDAKGNRCWSARMRGAPHAPKRSVDNGSLRSGKVQR